MPDFKPIETEYKGYRFRSRLEARWAVFFDAYGVKWDYEATEKAYRAAKQARFEFGEKGGL